MKRMWIFAIATLLFAGTAYAEDQCDVECPNGQTRVGFGDGDKATCQCFEPSGGMVETVPEAAENPSPAHGEPTADTAPDPTVVDTSEG